MKPVLKISLLCWTAFMLPRLVYHSAMTGVVGHCDPKFGCLGTWQIELLIAATFGLLSLLSLLPSLLQFKPSTGNRYLLSASLLLSVTYGWFLTTSWFDSSLHMVIAWLIYAWLVYALACGISRQTRWNNFTVPGNDRH
ncbi:hypothetical protein [Marinicella meishanensis]|uniref:hypothetical protein n=1 Tax=Marinicella meishanensis TaxID=2873263 RepID=UPI001CBFD491|nr:hypothetical protein [Marinicella sp. NBU2979]